MFSTREKEKERLVLSHLCNILNLIIICVVPSAPFHLYMPYMCKMKVYLRERDRERERERLWLYLSLFTYCPVKIQHRSIYCLLFVPVSSYDCFSRERCKNSGYPYRGSFIKSCDCTAILNRN